MNRSLFQKAWMKSFKIVKQDHFQPTSPSYLVKYIEKSASSLSGMSTMHGITTTGPITWQDPEKNLGRGEARENFWWGAQPQVAKKQSLFMPDLPTNRSFLEFCQQTTFTSTINFHKCVHKLNIVGSSTPTPPIATSLHLGIFPIS